MAPDATVLMVAEKPMLAASIAKLLSNSQANTRKGWNGACSISEYEGSFLGRRAKFKMTSTCGHVMTTDFPPKFNNWDRTDPAELFVAPTLKNEANPKLKMREFLASEARGCDYLVLWLDCDKEGENICFEVIDAVRDSMRGSSRSNFMDVVYRAHFSAITEKDLKYAMQNLGRPDENESNSVDARQELDLRIGCAFTRFQTLYFQGKYGDLDSSCISFGPCQTPTLAFCVARHDAITSFKPQPYWVLAPTILAPDNGQQIRPEWARKRMFDRDAAQIFLDRAQRERTATVCDVARKDGERSAPVALNTVHLLQIASAHLGLSPATAMHVAESLYTQGYISYPRTETSSYPANFDLAGTLRAQTGDAKWGAVARQILDTGIRRPKSGTDKGDHPPITPMRPRDGGLSGDSARLYDYITQHFIATLMGPCRFVTTKYRFTIGSEEFSAQSRQVTDPGFTAVLYGGGSGGRKQAWEEDDEDDDEGPDTGILPAMKKGDQLTIKESTLLARETSPPTHLSEAELIRLMERHGIGTDASIPVHIQTICTRNYVTVESGRRLVPTALGVALVHGYERVDRELVLPSMRAEVETQLNLIADGKADHLAVKNHALEMFRRKFVHFVQNIGGVDTLFEAQFTTLASSGRPFSKCGKCRRFMRLVDARPARLFCPTCHETYNLPQLRDGAPRPHAERKCPLDDFDLLYWAGTGGKLARSFVFCPFCYNHPPFEHMPAGSGCDRCPHPTCPNSYLTQGVSGCVAACSPDAVLMLDSQSAPKWRLVCTRCPSVVGLFAGASKVRVTDRACDECSAQLVDVEYGGKEKSPLPEGATHWRGCIFCAAGDEEEGGGGAAAADESKGLKSLISFKHAFMDENEHAHQLRATTRGGRRGGRGGRGGRGRGRGGGGGGAR